MAKVCIPCWRRNVARVLLAAFPGVLGCSAAVPGGRADLVEFGRIKSWPGGEEEKVFSHRNGVTWRPGMEKDGAHANLGVEWDEPREFDEVRVKTIRTVSVAQVVVEYWVSSWPPPEGRGGWTLTDTPWKGEWVPVRASPSLENGAIVFRFEPLSRQESANAERQPDFKPRYRRALKVRLRFAAADPTPVMAFEVFGASRWNQRAVRIETGCEGKPASRGATRIYNGRILGTTAQGRITTLRLLFLEHPPQSNDQTILSLEAGGVRFGVGIDDLIRHKGIYVRDAGAFLSDGFAGETFESFRASGRMRPGRDIMSRVIRHEEQSLDRAIAEIPALSMTGRNPYRYVPVGFFGNREKYAVMFNGNCFISKRGSKLFKDEQQNILWNGDSIRFLIGTGRTPDFREREHASRQRVLDDDLPVIVTEWSQEGIDYRAEAFATLVDAPLDPWKNRGDEPSVLLVKLTVANRGSEPKLASVWFHVDPRERLRLRDGILEAVGDSSTGYAAPRFRAAIHPAGGTLRVAPLPPQAGYKGDAALWEQEIGPGASAGICYRISFRSLADTGAMSRVAAVAYEPARAAVIEFWRGMLKRGMRLHVPDQVFNRFFRSVLQHILISVQRDVPTGLYMAPCGTYNYNMFANETNMQVRLLDMRALHDLAALFVEPFVKLQGSKPFPGRFRRTDAIFHGVRVDAEHDYTHSGYNLNHGWTLWTLAEHFLFTRDREWLKTRLPNIRRAVDWIVSERKATMRVDEHGDKVWEYGLLPAGQLEDNEELQYWYAVNGYGYRGLRAAAAAMAEIEPGEAARIASEADNYRGDIRAAALRSMAVAPVAPLLDGTWVPVVPSRAYLRGREVGWIRNILYGSHALVDCGVFDTEEAITRWILQDYEDNLFMSPMSFSVAEQDWFSRGGITLQPNLVNTAVTYMRRGQTPLALRAFYNAFAASYYPDVNAFTEWVPSFGKSGGPFFKTSDEAGFLTWLRLLLLREEGDRLYIASSAPRRWFRTGEQIEVADAATLFGRMGFRIDSHAADGYADAILDIPEAFGAREILLRIRHPEGKAISRAELDGVPHRAFDTRTEFVSLPVKAGRRRVRVFF